MPSEAINVHPNVKNVFELSTVRVLIVAAYRVALPSGCKVITPK
jgi:hypothetical protein